MVIHMKLFNRDAWYWPIIAGLCFAEVLTIIALVVPGRLSFFVTLPGLFAGSVFCEYSDSYPAAQALVANGIIGIFIGGVISVMRRLRSGK
jgi:hypothetical protein